MRNTPAILNGEIIYLKVGFDTPMRQLSVCNKNTNEVVLRVPMNYTYEKYVQTYHQNVNTMLSKQKEDDNF